MNLGSSISAVNKNNQRKLSINDRDEFIKFYYNKHKIIAQSVGNIGSINFFTDHYIKEDIVVVYCNDKEFVFEHKRDLMKAKGIDAYLGSIIKEIETKYGDEIKISKPIVNTDAAKEGDASVLKLSPGSVTYEDILKYKSQRKA
jgi:tRNA G10  N-methylase Trm11